MIDLNAIKAAADGALKHGETIGETEWYSADENMSIFAPSPDLTYIAAMPPATAKDLAELAQRLQSELAAAHEQLGYNAKPNDSQDWSKISGAVAHQLIERHADDWREAGDMMEAFAASRAAARPAVVLSAKQILKIADENGMFEQHDNAKPSSDCVVGFAQDILAAQQASVFSNDGQEPDWIGYDAAEREHLGDPDNKTGIYAPADAGQAQALAEGTE
jgi:hypothetical protein